MRCWEASADYQEVRNKRGSGFCAWSYLAFAGSCDPRDAGFSTCPRGKPPGGCCGFVGPCPSTTLDKNVVLLCV